MYQIKIFPISQQQTLTDPSLLLPRSDKHTLLTHSLPLLTNFLIETSNVTPTPPLPSPPTTPPSQKPPSYQCPEHIPNHKLLPLSTTNSQGPLPAPTCVLSMNQIINSSPSQQQKLTNPSLLLPLTESPHSEASISQLPAS